MSRKKSGRAKYAYKDSRTGKFTKQGRKYAVPSGVRYKGKYYKLDPEIEAKAYRTAQGKPKVKYTSGGAYIPEQVAKKITRSKKFKKVQKTKEEEYQEEIQGADIMAEKVPFYNVFRVFKEEFIEIFGYKSAKIRTYEEGKIKEPRSKSGALAEVAFQGYEAAKDVQKENEKGREGETPGDAMSIEIYMSEPGFYYIDFNPSKN